MSFYRGALSDLQIDRLAATWDDDAEQVVSLLGKVANSTASSHSSVVTLLAFVVFALSMWLFFLVPWGDTALLWGLFPAAIFAGSLGSGIRTLLTIRGGVTAMPQTTWVELGLGATVGLVTAMLFLLAQIGLSGDIQISIPSADYTRVTMIASTISTIELAVGVGFEPTELSLSDFQDRRLRPLGHPTVGRCSLPI